MHAFVSAPPVLFTSLVLTFGLFGCGGEDSAATETDATPTDAATTGQTTGAGSTSTSGGGAGGSETSGASQSSSGASQSSSESGTTSSTGDTSTSDDASTTDDASTAGDTGDVDTTGANTGTTGAPVDTCSPEAEELVALVNAYRQQSGKPSIPLSPSMCTVGDLHVKDLATNAPHAPAGCTLHSWSNRGAWTPCCYTANNAQAECMWDKPQELTVYPGYGFETAALFGDAITPAKALEMWKASAPHNEVILSQGIWSDPPWGSIGAGLQDGYAVLWFGVETDPAG